MKHKCVDFTDVRDCVKLGISYGWTLEEFLESMDLWEDFVEGIRYIPADKKPEKEGTYLVTMDGEICGEEDPITTICGFYNGKWDELEVLAWTELPEPYKGKA